MIYGSEGGGGGGGRVLLQRQIIAVYIYLTRSESS